MKESYYRRILKRYSDSDFLGPCSSLVKDNTVTKDDIDINHTFVITTLCVTAPVFTAFITYVLNDALSRNLKKLYFVARDGLMLYNIAKILCDAWNVKIECSYLYCSRYSLRYIKMLEDESDLLNTELTNTLAYFKQEFEICEFGIVDTGWMGTVQENIYKIYRYLFGTEPKIEGYYFGMYKSPNNQFGNYHTWYFSVKKNFFRSFSFSNNLLECLCSANHGMTIGYEYFEKKWIPLLKHYEPNEMVENQLSLCKQYAVEFTKFNQSLASVKKFQNTAYLLIRSFMQTPSYEEAHIFAKFKFTDKMDEKMLVPIATPMSAKQLILLYLPIKRKQERLVPYWLGGALVLGKNTKVLSEFVGIIFSIRTIMKLWMKR
jgi:hypothetical protein